MSRVKDMRELAVKAGVVIDLQHILATPDRMVARVPQVITADHDDYINPELFVYIRKV